MRKNRQPSTNVRSEERQRALATKLERDELQEMARRITIIIDWPLFNQICKFGFVKDTTQDGRVDITFNRVDVANLCKGSVLVKSISGMQYMFSLSFNDRILMVETLRNSPLFSQVIDVI